VLNSGSGRVTDKPRLSPTLAIRQSASPNAGYVAVLMDELRLRNEDHALNVNAPLIRIRRADLGEN
jgi:hypothetical protein